MYAAMCVPIFLLLSVISVAECVQESLCVSQPSGHLKTYDADQSICCDGRILNRFGRNREELGCCYNVTYKLHGEVCCQGKVYPKFFLGSRQEQVCCGGTLYFKDEVGVLCCDGNYHNISGATDVECCGKELYQRRSQICCTGRDKKQATITNKTSTTRCCHSQSYDKTTSDCYHKRLVVPKHNAFCGDKLYDTRILKCCNNETLYNRSRLHECCGAQYISNVSHRCCNTDHRSRHVAPRTAGCCGNTHFNTNIQRCCRGNILLTANKHDDCCGSTLFDKRFQSCCGSKIHNITLTGSLATGMTHCCGSNVINTSNQICCENSHVLSKTDHRQNSCCLTAARGTVIPYNSHTEICTNGRVTGISNIGLKYCGQALYDETADLCCNSKVQKSARRDGKQCCHPGTEVYDPNTEICCDGVVYLARSRPECDPVVSQDLHYDICSICSWDKSDYMSAILDGQLQTCHRQALWFRVEKFDQKRKRGLQRTILWLTFKGDIDNVHNKSLIGQTTTIEIPCSCKRTLRSIRDILILSDFRFTRHPRRLGDSDWLLPHTRRIKRKLKKQYGKCRTQKADMLQDVKEFIEFKIRKATAE